VHQPNRGLAVVGVLPQDVGFAIAVEVTAANDVPLCSRIGKRTAGNQCGPVHQPDRGRSISFLPENVSITIGVEIRRADDVPTNRFVWPGLSTAKKTRSVHEPDNGGAVVVLPENVGMAVVIEIA